MESDQGIVKSKRREEPSVKPFTPTVKAAEEATLTSRLGERAKLAQLLDDITSTPATADLGVDVHTLGASYWNTRAKDIFRVSGLLSRSRRASSRKLI